MLCYKTPPYPTKLPAPHICNKEQTLLYPTTRTLSHTNTPNLNNITMAPRGEAIQTKVHYKGKEDDFLIFVDSEKAVQDWKQDKSIPLAQVVNGWKVFVTHK